MASESGVKKNDLAAAGTAQGQAGSAYNTVNPIYQQMVTNPTGYTPQEKADLTTASAQGLGGAVSGATGEADLATARTGNTGGYASAIADAARTAGVTQSQNDLKIDTDSDALARQQQEIGLQGLNSIYANANQTGLGYSNAAGNVQPGFWQKAGLAAIAGGAQVGAAFAGKPGGGN